MSAGLLGDGDELVRPDAGRASGAASARGPRRRRRRPSARSMSGWKYTRSSPFGPAPRRSSSARRSRASVRAAHGLVEDTIAVAAVLLGLVHGGVGVVQQVVGPASGSRVKAMPMLAPGDDLAALDAGSAPPELARMRSAIAIAPPRPRRPRRGSRTRRRRSGRRCRPAQDPRSRRRTASGAGRRRRGRGCR